MSLATDPHAGGDPAPSGLAGSCGSEPSHEAVKACSGLCGLSRVTLHLARCHDYPEGSAARGYAFVAPLDEAGRLSAEGWRRAREQCVVRRFWGDEPDRIGHLLHARGGEGGATWIFAYSDSRGRVEEAGIHMADHRFVPGEYVSIRHDDEEETFRVAEVRKACSG